MEMTASQAAEFSRIEVQPRVVPARASRVLDLDSLYRTTLDRLRRIAAGLGLAPADADDALHDSYVALMREKHRFDEQEEARR